MNIHIAPDEKFIDAFIENKTKLNNNAIDIFYVVIKEGTSLKHVTNKTIIPIVLNKSTFRNIIDNNKVKNIFFHSFSLEYQSYFRYISNTVNKYWIFYGAELYQTPIIQKILDKDSELLYYTYMKKKKALVFLPLLLIKYLIKVREAIVSRKIESLIANFDYFCHWNKKDYEYIRDSYPKFKAKYHFFGYASVKSSGSSPEFHNNSQINNNILLGNYASVTLNHHRILKKLSSTKKKDFKVFCPLSYGDAHYRELIVQCGEDLLQENFVPVTKFMPKTDYEIFFDKIDVVVMNNVRTQGAGNISMALKAGKKIYLNSRNTHYLLLRELGVVLFTIDELLKSSIDQIFTPLTTEEKMHNFTMINNFINEVSHSYNDLP